MIQIFVNIVINNYSSILIYNNKIDDITKKLKIFIINYFTKININMELSIKKHPVIIDKILELYNSIKDNISQNLHQELFNLCLVYSGMRPAMLLETANHHELTQQFLARIPRDKFRIVSDNFRLPRYYIFKIDKFTDKLDEEFDINNSDDRFIGEILGFSCPGHMRGLWSINYFVNGENFYVEKCNNYELIKDQQQLQSQSFKMIADFLEIKFEEQIQKNLSNNEIIQAIREKNKELFSKHKDIIGSIYYDIACEELGDLICDNNLTDDNMNCFASKLPDIIIYFSKYK